MEEKELMLDKVEQGKVVSRGCLLIALDWQDGIIKESGRYFPGSEQRAKCTRTGRASEVHEV
jgi:hypothetical protein